MNDDDNDDDISGEPNPFDYTFVLSWCPNQGAIHIRTLAEEMTDSMDCLDGNVEVYDRDPWLVMAVGPEGAIRRMGQDLKQKVKAKFAADVAIGKVMNAKF